MGKDKKVVFLCAGNKVVGSGHAYRVGNLGHLLSQRNYDVTVCYRPGDELVRKVVEGFSVPCRECDYLDVDRLHEFHPDIVILDMLDTEFEFVKSIREKSLVISFEDLGEGAAQADMVVNALYPEKQIRPRHYFGHNYVVLRPEFLGVEYSVREKVSRIILSFGGTDPNDLSLKVFRAVNDYCIGQGITIEVILGLGYSGKITKEACFGEHVEVRQNISNMAQALCRADVVFCSAGRTVYECAAVGVPAIVLCHNRREMTHFFASEEYGFLNLGLGVELSETDIQEAFSGVEQSVEARKYMSDLMKSAELDRGAERILDLIEKLV